MLNISWVNVNLVLKLLISFYSPQMVGTVNTTKYTIENDLTRKEKKEKKQTHRHTGSITLPGPLN